MVDYKVPGVYVEEPTGLSLSVQTGETAIPVFAFDEKGGSSFAKNSEKSISLSKATPFDSWMDIVAIQNALNAANPDSKTDFDKTYVNDHLYQSLRLFFLNGGGRCYVAPVTQLTELVPQLDDATLLVQAGTKLEDFNVHVSKLCTQGKTLFAICDGPDVEVNKVDSTKYAPNAYAAVYYPWLKVDNVNVPPSGAVAGVYARVDRERGVWKAPANVVISGAEPAFSVSDEKNGEWNTPAGGLSINVIRKFRGAGTLIWGARTLKSEDNNWRYVPVRRLFSAVEKDIKTAMSTALFEPNSSATWERVRSAVDSYLHGLWKQGALQGDSPQQAYFVMIGLGTTMTPDHITNGTMIVKVGLAAVRPAEFIILQLSQDVVPG